MANYYEVIKELYPDILDEDFQLKDDGDGQVYLGKWNYAAPKPNLSEHKTRADYFELLYTINPPILQKLADLDAKTIRALRTSDTNRLKLLESEAEELRKGLIK